MYSDKFIIKSPAASVGDFYYAEPNTIKAELFSGFSSCKESRMILALRIASVES